jgi:hypothetical protein
VVDVGDDTEISYPFSWDHRLSTDAGADDPSPSSTPEPLAAEQRPEEPSRQVFEPGAASMEPPQAIDEDGGSAAHLAWVDSIHTSP